MITTGAMHEDGLADTVDGLWGGWTRDRRLEIMKDSHIGTYGVLALIVSAGLRWSVLAGLLTLGAGPVVAIAVLSRASMPALMAALPNARGDGLAHKVGAPPPAVLALSRLSRQLPCRDRTERSAGYPGRACGRKPAGLDRVAQLAARRAISGASQQITGWPS